ncbi:MAG: hypothetical protein ACYC6Y_12990 [Thermoguttaceae bacterium]
MCDLVVGLLMCLAAAPAAASGSHPCVFATAADVARVREAVSDGQAIAGRLDALVRECQTARLEDLPSLERDWWETDRSKPWAETYPL